MAITAMFPLGSALTPGTALPLRIFEPRYRELLADCLAGDGTFGVVLIERGSEVGGGDTRFDVGTLAHIDDHRELDDGQSAILISGRERIRIDEWLDDDPYPRARVTPWPDAIDADPEHAREIYSDCIVKLRRLLATAGELGHAVPAATFDVPADPGVGSHLLGALTPLGPLDRQHLLQAPGASRRLELLSDLIDEQAAMLPIG